MSLQRATEARGVGVVDSSQGEVPARGVAEADGEGHPGPQRGRQREEQGLDEGEGDEVAEQDEALLLQGAKQDVGQPVEPEPADSFRQAHRIGV